MADEQQPQQQQAAVPRPRTTRPRPESTVVQAFSDDLDSMFGLTPEVEFLEGTISAKKQVVSSGERELLELEARLREAEKRLARVSRSGSPVPILDSSAQRAQNDENRAPTTTTSYTSPLAQKPTYPADRPPTGKRQDTQHIAQSIPGAMPETPRYGAANDYVMVGRTHAGAERGYA